ncbi:hypothetical protein CCAX7_13120 [Capsulimonas corticalis]|uniref:Uncharacterized protein n=1 Tax=Capsulimonas corticalis TaxID=2219043 RepID=A0A402D4P3_9BACT|nr:DUF1003 domain-containing protein [Capsulimonas corticalis]BDI29261.1 hypothetical protein CCAX7_13120 [Capsulimonas corticalis]
MPTPREQEPSEEYTTPNPILSDVIERNIRTIDRLRMEAAQARKTPDRVSDIITDFSGRLIFVYVHILWFGSWILLNTGKVGVRPFDPYPYGLLTMVVSLEAIFLSTFVLISQNRLSVEADRRADLDLQIGLLTEHEVTRVLRMLDVVQDKLGIENEEDIELAQLELATKPEDVLAEIDMVHRNVRRHATWKEWLAAHPGLKKPH